MYLKSLTLKGFKSFADRTTLQFDPGLTVVVGPNGSGKSNISDSILWVLGEQSAKMLRGQAMEDVIFSGSSGRVAVGLAEVTLTLDNADHTLPIDFSEIAITRRMYRSGESEYLINGAPCRLRDITDILHDSGLGKETHSIISQGKLDSILASRPEERRELIEEAAGISKHRKRKERSERKLAAMQDNLTRAKDIQREIMRQLRPLERQVDKAKRHRDLTEELSRLTCTLAVDDLRQLQEAYGVLETRGHEADAALELAQYRLDTKSHELEKYQSLLEQKGIFVGDLGEQRRRMQGVLGRMESDMRLLEEKGKNMVARASEMRLSLSNMERSQSALGQELEGVQADLADARAREADLRDRVGDLAPQAKEASDLRRRLSGEVARLSGDQRQAQREVDKETLAHAKLKDQISNAEVEDQMFQSRLDQIRDSLETASEALRERKAQRSGVEEELRAARTSQEEAQARISSLQGAAKEGRRTEREARDRLNRAQATLSALEALDDQLENANDLVARLAKDRPGLVRSRFADLLEVDPAYEGLVELLLGEDLAALVAEDGSAQRDLLAHALTLSTKGRATVLCLDGRAGAQDGEEGLPGMPLASAIRPAPGAEDLVASLFGRTYVVEDLGEALAASVAHPTCTFVTPQGVVAMGGGRAQVGAARGSDQGALERKRRIRAGRRDLTGLREALDEATAAVASAEEGLAGAREASLAAQGEVARLTGELSSLTSDQGRLEAQVRQASSEEAKVTKNRAAAGERTSQARREVERHRKAAEAAKERLADLTDRLEEATSKRAQASREESDLSQRLSDAKLKLATVSERRAHLASGADQLARRREDVDRRIRETMRSAETLDVVQLRVNPLYRRYEAIYQRAVDWAARLKDRASLAEADSDSLKRTIGEARDAVSAATKEVEEAKAQVSQVKVEKGRLEVQVENAINRIVSDGTVLEDALQLPAPKDRSALERKVEALRRDIDSIGPVNEVAMDQYSRLKDRADYISAQVEDLEKARTSLRKIMAAIERKMRRQFVVVFDRVNANFAQIFSLLFPGGQAHLELTDPDHLDATGVEIVAQPRGKKIQKMTLMSGGEKSLTALALLFAVYKTRTVPFYVFDEVEAALDDSNLSKLLDAIETLKETTQLIVISHQRRTMEQADVLYGVSMQADGVSHVVSQRLDKATGKVVDA